MELRHLRYFVKVAEELNFSRAAERLNIAQPPLSQQIQRLERELGVPLFLRTKRRVALSDAGSAILDDARRTVALADEVADIARRTALGEVGILRLGFSSVALYTMLPAILRAFRSQFPRAVLNLMELSTEEQVRRLASGALDAGIVRLPIENVSKSLTTRSILREPLAVAMPRDHRLAKRPAVPIRALAPERFVVFPRHVAPGLYDQIMSLCSSGGFRPIVAQEAAEIPTIISLVAAGLGIAIVPSSVQSLRHERVVYRALRPGNTMTEMAIAYERDNRSAVLRSFLQVVARHRALPPEAL
jgi:DNA-binding transcriptional LysR family regulator